MKNDCRGFLSDKYICGLCNTSFCKDCHHIQEEEEEHKCDPNEVATINELKKSTKPCPKCYIPIFKIDGCDQMFCISCHTAFSWKTGEVELGIIHNPHYFQALREGNIQYPRHRDGCEPLNYHLIIKIIRESFLSVKDKRILQTYYQQFVHHRQVSLNELRREENIRDLRIKYLTNEYDEKTFKQKIFVIHQHRVRRREESQILESFITIGEDLLKIMNHENINDILNQLNKLKDLTFEAFLHLDKKFQHVGYINPHHIFQVFI
jgi:hypothetical protein